MAVKLGRKEMPSGCSADDFKYQGRPAVDQDDFGSEVGIADMVCVNQFGDANNNKYYHAGVVRQDGAWYVYLEWGRVSGGGKTWDGSFRGQDFQFVTCSGEDDARTFFEKQCRSKNIKRLQQKKVGGKEIWVGKSGKDGYVVQRLATRERGLPDACLIKDDSGVEKKKAKKKATKKKTSKKKIDAQPQVIALAKSLVGGTADYARAASRASGVTPTMEAITEVRDDLIPQALAMIKRIGDDHDRQLRDKKLQELSTYVATIVPRPIPRGGDPSAVILNSTNILLVQQDLDAFEAALKNEDWEVEVQEEQQIDPNAALKAEIEWLDMKSGRGKWVVETFTRMSKDRHRNIGDVRVLNAFVIRRSRVDDLFVAGAKHVASVRKGNHEQADMQPDERHDVSDIADLYERANMALLFHGTRSVNVAPILQTDLRLPKSLKGVHITGAAFGHGIYWASDFRKAANYCSIGSGLYSSGAGAIRGRGAFMFMGDVVLGKPYMAKKAWSLYGCPRGFDSIYATNRHCASLVNDEHVVFGTTKGPSHRLRYLLEISV